MGDDGAPSAAELTADATSLRVQKGTGGMKALGDSDKANIHQTIDDEVLKRARHRVPLDRRSAGDARRGRADARLQDAAARASSWWSATDGAVRGDDRRSSSPTSA